MSEFIDTFVDLANSKPKHVAVAARPRVKELRGRIKELLGASRFDDALPLLSELAELTAESVVLKRLAMTLRHLHREPEAARIIAALRRRSARRLKSRNASRAGTKAGAKAGEKAGRRRRGAGAAGSRTGVRGASGEEVLQEEMAAGRRLQVNASALQDNLRIIEGLQTLVSERLETQVTHVKSEPVKRARVSPSRANMYMRSYTRHWFEVAGAVDPGKRVSLDAEGRLAVFAKSALNLKVHADLERHLSGQHGRGFRVPFFFGTFEDCGLQIGAWEYVPANAVPIKDQSQENQERIVRAIAGVNSLPLDGVEHVTHDRLTESQRWFERALGSLDTSQREKWEALREPTAELQKQRIACFERIRSLGNTFLTHNDIGIANLVVPDSGDAVIFDWENSGLATPGIDLGFLTRTPRRRQLVGCYLEEMRKYGHELDRADVDFVADVTWGYRILRRGWTKRQIGLVELGLKLVSAHLK